METSIRPGCHPDKCLLVMSLSCDDVICPGCHQLNLMMTSNPGDVAASTIAFQIMALQPMTLPQRSDDVTTARTWSRARWWGSDRSSAWTASGSGARDSAEATAASARGTPSRGALWWRRPSATPTVRARTTRSVPVTQGSRSNNQVNQRAPCAVTWWAVSREGHLFLARRWKIFRSAANFPNKLSTGSWPHAFLCCHNQPISPLDPTPMEIDLARTAVRDFPQNAKDCHSLVQEKARDPNEFVMDLFGWLTLWQQMSANSVVLAVSSRSMSNGSSSNCCSTCWNGR